MFSDKGLKKWCLFTIARFVRRLRAPDEKARSRYACMAAADTSGQTPPDTAESPPAQEGLTAHLRIAQGMREISRWRINNRQ
jgi:hypothetical protein